MADGTITFSTALDNEQLEAGIKQAEKDVLDLQKKLNKSESSRSSIEQEMDDAEAAIKRADAEVERLQTKLAQLQAPTENPLEFMERAPEVERTKVELDEAKQSLDKLLDTKIGLEKKWADSNKEVAKYSQSLDTTKAHQAELADEMAKIYSKNNSALNQGLASAGESFNHFGKRINTMMKKVFLFGVILAGLRALKGYISDAMSENNNLAKSFEGMKATVAGFAAGLVNAFAPAILGFISIVTAMFTTLARIIDAIFKTNIAASIEAAKKAAGATKKQAKATRDLAKAQKEANAQIMSFDEINKVDDPDKSDSSSGDAAGGAGGSDFPGLMIGKIDETLTAIMGILGAALMAVGAILCFSGVNIPLGIGLMVIGALMVYTAAQENWQKLPAELQQAITGALVLTGIIMLVIGAVLAFGVPTAQGIGVGMMIGGALLIWSAVALNWQSMPAEVQTIISALMVMLGAALLVIGAILAFSGGGTPLGVALMVAGAASLVAAVALNWDNLPAEVQSAIGIIMSIVSVAFLVLGAILTLSGAAAPLGVGLLIVGAGMLVSAVALNWDKMPQDVQNTVTALLGIIGAALIVIGIILLCTGVGIPLGIACILAGIGSFVAAIALNYDFITDCIKNIWSSVTSWWDTHVAPIFTAAYWREKFKSIINGLIYCVNRGLSAFGDFVNSIGNGIGSILGTFGISASVPSISMPQIPYLAQGAVIPPNRKFMAVLGDQTSGNNLEAPESLIRQIVREEADSGIDYAAMQTAMKQAFIFALSTMGGFGEGGSDTPIILSLNVDGEELARAETKGKNRLIQRGELQPELNLF